MGSSGSSFHRPATPHLTRGAMIAALVSGSAVVTVVAVLVLGTHGSSSAPASSARGSVSSNPFDARITLAAGSPVTVPSSFLGISTEYWTISKWARQVGPLRRVFAMLSRDGPIRLRIGGNSADRSLWAPSKELPEWVFELTPSWLRQTSQIVRQTHVKLILDLNQVTATPAIAGRWARTAITRLPRASITAFEIGNEPDIYNRGGWRWLTAGRVPSSLPRRITAASYARSFHSYANALAKVAPGVPLLAPALGNPHKNYGWVSKLLKAPHPGLVGITTHQYTYSACAKRGSPGFPTIARLLSEYATVSMGRAALTVERVSDRARLPLWLTEMNSVTCGGIKGVSDTFATALWAPDALFELVRAGVESASIHVRSGTINKAFSLTRNGLVAYPLLYGMVLFARTLGPGAQLIPVHLAAPAGLHLTAWAVRLHTGVMHTLLLDKGPRSGRVHVKLALTGAATVQRLTAPEVSSTGHATLDNQHLTRTATWAGTPRVEKVTPTASGYVIPVARYSAALVTARLRPGH